MVVEVVVVEGLGANVQGFSIFVLAVAVPPPVVVVVVMSVILEEPVGVRRIDEALVSS